MEVYLSLSLSLYIYIYTYIHEKYFVLRAQSRAGGRVLEAVDHVGLEAHNIAAKTSKLFVLVIICVGCSLFVYVMYTC